MKDEASKNILSVKFTDKAMLYSHYMPFIQGGGLFIPSQSKKLIGEEVFILVKLMNDEDPTPIVGRVVWKTPSASDGNRTKGFGIQFIRDDSGLRERIELVLGVDLHSGKPTMTL